ncbi:hypothetical protein SAY87_024367 [Trapa incisa]|uniref:Mediator of RNA polymerase II transcription subunit 13 n=1 Tax=Trapa incisa TaxID=236973 RepID=A0AAN7GFT7_9MYRT|nr:hypothetical protein SAY87_024367 [Trapa incisa]
MQMNARIVEEEGSRSYNIQDPVERSISDRETPNGPIDLRSSQTPICHQTGPAPAAARWTDLLYGPTIPLSSSPEQYREASIKAPGMWTNIFKIGGLQQISWFQFLPPESELNSLADKRCKLEGNDVATYLVLSSHIQLQNKGYLSTWTNSFVGPWDPSQGVHNPDEKIKLWLFLPGHHTSVVEAVQVSVSKLRVVASGVWLTPGDSEEIAAALSQALRNCIERSMSVHSYMRYGDVYSKYNPFHSEEIIRRGQPIVEFEFSATEEAIFIHVIISARHIHALSGDDMENISKRCSDGRLPVIVSPNGMRGRLTGCCPGDLVKQVYLSSGHLKASSMLGLPSHVSQGQLRGHNYFAEVTIGCVTSETVEASQSGLHNARSTSKNYVDESRTDGKIDQKRSEGLFLHEKTLVYPVESVLVPVLQTSLTRSSLKRLWLQNWLGPSLHGSSFFMHWAPRFDSFDGGTETNGIRSQHSYYSSSNSNSSSLSGSSSESDYRMIVRDGDLDADADSLTCKQSDISSADHLENDHVKAGSKRPRPGVTAVQDGYKSEFTSLEVNDSAITGFPTEQIGSHWDLDGDDRGADMDIQALLSEFGDFGDFFVNDDLPFGEPPGTAESHTLILSGSDLVVGSSPAGVIDVPEDVLLPVAGFSSFESFNPPLPVSEECISKSQEVAANAMPSVAVPNTPVSSSGDFDHLIKAEALMTFAPEYGAVEAPLSDISSSIFRSPYLPKSRNLDCANSSTNNYKYGATPPSSPPCADGSDEKSSRPVTSRNYHGRHDLCAGQHPKNYYTHVDGGKVIDVRRSTATSKVAPVVAFTSMSSTIGAKSIHGNVSERSFQQDHVLLSSRTAIATDIECSLLQSSMCKARHTLISSSSIASINSCRLTGGSIINTLPGDQSTLTDNVFGIDSVPVGIASDVDGLPDAHATKSLNVWRTVEVPKLSKQSNSPAIEVSLPLAHHSYGEESILSHGQMQPLKELLEGLPFLVQQATSFVDFTLDADCGDGPYGWLALEEQRRRGFCCGPSMVHAGCGGTLSSCHFLDIAGVELVDPLFADVHASSVLSLLYSDIKSALKSAFGSMDGLSGHRRKLEGPLTVQDWCKGRSHAGDTGNMGDGLSAESSVGESRDTMSLSGGEPYSPSLSTAVATSNLKGSIGVECGKADDPSQRRSNQESILESEQHFNSRRKSTLYVLPFPAILVGYQDDWLKTSTSSLQLWEKAPFEPYASPKHITYSVVCPDIDPLTSAATDFFHQLGTVYEACKLGSHTPQTLVNQMDIDSAKPSTSGFVFLDCPQSVKMDINHASLVGAISDYFLSLSNSWDLTSYLKSLSKTLKALKLDFSMPTNPREGTSGSFMVVYVICPFPEPMAILRTVIESSVAVGSVVIPSDRKSVLHNQVAKALNCSAGVDEASISNILVISGFSVPKLVIQIVTVDTIFRVTSPSLGELAILKETAFTVYNKARRISRGSSSEVQSSSLSSRSQSSLAQMTSSIPSMWKDSVNPRMSGPSLPREGEIDANMRIAAWENSWQTRGGVLSCDISKSGGSAFQEESCFMFEPLFILSEPASVDQGISPTAYGGSISESTKPQSDDNTGSFLHSGSSASSIDAGNSSLVDGSELNNYSPGHQKQPSIHCCYGWTEDWRWLVCIWTDARGELLDTHIFPFGGISSRQDTKGLQCLFAQVLQQGCLILQACCSDNIVKPRDFVIARIGSYFELEYLEWQKAIYSVGGAEMKSWSLQLRRSRMDGISTGSSGPSLPQQEMSMIQERAMPSSPSLLYSPQSKPSGYMKGSLGQQTARKQLVGGQAAGDGSRGLLHWVQNISFVTVCVDHSLHLVHQADSTSLGGSQVAFSTGQPQSHLEGFTTVKSLGSASASYLLIPSPSMRFLPSTPFQLPTCLTAESPPLAHLLHSKGAAIPLSTAFVVSRAVPSMRKDFRANLKDEWPSVLAVGLIDHYGGTNSSNSNQEKVVRGGIKQRSLNTEPRDFEVETHSVLESVAAELQALSWMTVSPTYMERRTALPFHCDMVLRLRRLLHFADKELSRSPEKS